MHSPCSNASQLVVFFQTGLHQLHAIVLLHARCEAPLQDVIDVFGEEMGISPDRLARNREQQQDFQPFPACALPICAPVH
jgi:hypothetical protein